MKRKRMMIVQSQMKNDTEQVYILDEQNQDKESFDEEYHEEVKENEEILNGEHQEEEE